MPKKIIHARSNITIGTWNVRTMKDVGKLEELQHGMKRYDWLILGLCESRLLKAGEKSTQEGHRLFWSGQDNIHAQGVGLLVHKNTVNCVIDCCPISNRLITIRLRDKPFNITIIQAYAPASAYSKEDEEVFYEELQKVLNKTPKKDIRLLLLYYILVVQGDWNAKIGEDAYENWKGTCGRHCNIKSNERGLRLLEFASYNDLMVANTFGSHRTPRKVTWHSPDGKTHNQINYIMVKKRFSSSVNIGKTRSFPGADIGNDHKLVMLTFKLHLKRTKKQGHARIRFDVDKLKDPHVVEVFQAMIGGKFAALSILDSDMDLDTLTDTFNAAVTDTANEILGKHRPVKKPWVTAEILDLCDKRRELKKKKKKKKNDAEGTTEYRTVNRQIKKGMKKAKEDWIGEQCENMEDSLKKNNSKRAYHLVKGLTSTKQERTTTTQDKSGTCLTENEDVLKRWTEYCSELYNYRATGDPEVLNVPPATNIDSHPIHREEVEAALKTLKKGKSAGVDNIPSEMVQAGGEDMISVLLIICNKIWQTGEWPTKWTQSLVITLPKKGNLQLCQNYRTISLISYPSKVMLKIILNSLKPEAEKNHC